MIFWFRKYLKIKFYKIKDDQSLKAKFVTENNSLRVISFYFYGGKITGLMVTTKDEELVDTSPQDEKVNVFANEWAGEIYTSQIMQTKIYNDQAKEGQVLFLKSI